MLGFLSSKKDSGTGLRLRMLAYFIATIVVMVSLAAYAFYMHNGHHARLLQLRVEEHGLRELHGELTHTLDRELRTWRDLLLRGTETGLYHELLGNYYQAERVSRQLLGDLALNEQGDAPFDLVLRGRAGARSRAEHALVDFQDRPASGIRRGSGQQPRRAPDRQLRT